jgi:hypothetical protein
MPQLTETPFFIVGNPRSGTTLLRFILSSHPRIYIPGETGFIPFLPRIGGKLSLAQVQRVLDRIGRLNANWYGLVEDLPSFYNSLLEPTLCQVLDALYRRKIAEYDDQAVRWGDKTPTYVRYISELGDIFTSARFVHLIRDGRDATLSAQKKWGTQRWYMDNYYLLKNWVRNIEEGQRAGCALGPDRYLEVRYEYLVQQPRAALERICAFLGEKLHPSMLNHTELAREQVGPGGHVEVRKPISSASIGRWRSEMSSFDQKLADRVAGATLSALGYELSGSGSFIARERVKLLGLASKYQVTDATRRILMSLGILTLNRAKRGQA